MDPNRRHDCKNDPSRRAQDSSYVSEAANTCAAQDAMGQPAIEWYECFHCDEAYDSYLEMRQHVSRAHFKCDACGAEFKTLGW